jgi:hypothetical protein
MSALASTINSTGRHSLIGTFVEVWRDLVSRLFDSYRPELHYMRGPGPKCREKALQRHGAQTQHPCEQAISTVQPGPAAKEKLNLCSLTMAATRLKPRPSPSVR